MKGIRLLQGIFLVCLSLFLILTALWIFGLLIADIGAAKKIHHLPAYTYGSYVLFHSYTWLGKVIASFFPWPATLLIVLAGCVQHKLHLPLLNFLDRLKTLRFGGAEVTVSPISKEQLEHNAEGMHAYLLGYRRGLNRKLVHLIKVLGIEAKLAHLAEEVIKPALITEGQESFRCTIYMEDFIYENFLCQIVEYYYGPGKSKGKMGRFFPDGYGVIGRVWRSFEDTVTGTLDISSDVNMPADTEDQIRYIAQNWGMRRENAENALHYPTFGCVLIKYETKNIGMIYFDCKDVRNAFAPGTNLEALKEKIASQWEAINLPKALNSLNLEMLKFATPINLMEEISKDS